MYRKTTSVATAERIWLAAKNRIPVTAKVRSETPTRLAIGARTKPYTPNKLDLEKGATELSQQREQRLNCATTYTYIKISGGKNPSTSRIVPNLQKKRKKRETEPYAHYLDNTGQNIGCYSEFVCSAINRQLDNHVWPILVRNLNSVINHQCLK